MLHLPARATRTLVSFLAVFALAACAEDGGDAERYVELPVEHVYNEAVDTLRAEEYGAAARRFDDVERQHPYSQWAVKASLMAAFAHYQAADYDSAVLALNRFIRLHPGNRDIAYAYYLRALCFYERISDVARDQANTVEAETALREVVRRFPDTRYARDAQLKIDLARDHLAGKEMEIGRYYLTRGHYLSAIRRFQRVVDSYETTTHVPEALHRLTEAYLALGLEEEAKKAAAVLGHNYPGSEWYADSYRLATEDAPPRREEEGFFAQVFGWSGRAFDWVF